MLKCSPVELLNSRCFKALQPYFQSILDRKERERLQGYVRKQKHYCDRSIHYLKWIPESVNGMVCDHKRVIGTRAEASDITLISDRLFVINVLT